VSGCVVADFNGIHQWSFGERTGEVGPQLAPFAKGGGGEAVGIAEGARKAGEVRVADPARYGGNRGLVLNQGGGGPVEPHPAHGVGDRFAGHRMKDAVKMEARQGGHLGQRIEGQIARGLVVDMVENADHASFIVVGQGDLLSLCCIMAGRAGTNLAEYGGSGRQSLQSKTSGRRDYATIMRRLFPMGPVLR